VQTKLPNRDTVFMALMLAFPNAHEEGWKDPETMKGWFDMRARLLPPDHLVLTTCKEISFMSVSPYKPSASYSWKSYLDWRTAYKMAEAMRELDYDGG